MNAVISAKVGYQSSNKPGDVRIIHDLLKRVPATKGGPAPSFDAARGYGQQTDQAIYNFQLRHFAKSQCDASVWPGGGTLAKLNEAATGTPGTAPAAPPATGRAAEPARIAAVMTSRITGFAYIKGMDLTQTPHAALGRFRVPLYRLEIGLADTSGSQWSVASKTLELDVIRFGVSYRSAAYNADKKFNECFKTVGPPEGTFNLKRHQSKNLGGTWKITGDYLIHVGPGNPKIKASDDNLRALAGAVGCIEICEPGKMRLFDEVIRILAFGELYSKGGISAEAADKRISEAGSFRCIIESASPPALMPLTDFTMIGGPKPARG